MSLALSLALLAVGLSLLSGVVAFGADRRPVLLKYVSFTLLGASGVLSATAGILALASGGVETTTLPFGLPWLAWRLRLDALSGLLQLLIGLVLFAVAFYGPGYTREFGHGRHSLWVLGLFTGLFVAGMQLVVLADDAFLFMVAWELMSLSSYFLVAYQHEQAANRRAAFLYLLMAHAGALAILLGFAVLAAHGTGFDFDSLRAAPLPGPWASVAFTLAFIGFGMKAGLMPLHAWLPEAHPVAPSHISALMSGVMLKVAVYGLVRFVFDLVGELHWGWGMAALLLGSATAVLGILYALMQSDLKRLLAYSSVENVGIIFMGLGLALIFAGTGHPVLSRIALVAALYHALNHALFKSLLFLGAGAVLSRSHERDLERMGGLLKVMPVTGYLVLVGCISIAGLPPFNGFVSEWLTFQAALQAPALQSGVLRALIPVSAALLALTGALAAAGFVKVYGIAFLGQARSRHVRHAREVGLGMRIGMALLAALCLLLGVLPTQFLELLDSVPRLLLGGGLASATTHGWLWLTPVSPDVASYSAPLVLVGLAVAAGLSAWVLRRGAPAVRRAVPWDCGFGPLNARMQYTATAFAQPIRRVFHPVWRIQEEVQRPEGPGFRPASLRYVLAVGDRAWSLVYEPIARGVLNAARRVGRIQTGSIRSYLAYSFFTLIFLLWLITQI